jgi:hypothetical protein
VWRVSRHETGLLPADDLKRITLRYSPEDRIHHNYRGENLKTYYVPLATIVCLVLERVEVTKGLNEVHQGLHNMYRTNTCRMIKTRAVQRFYILGRIWLMAVEARAPCGDCNNNNNKVKLIVLLIKTTDFIFMTVFPEIFWSSLEIIFICKQESARDGELSEDRFMTPRQ